APARRCSEGAAGGLPHEAGGRPTALPQRVPDAAACPGAMAWLRFRARSAERATVTTSLYLQVDDGRPCSGTAARTFTLEPGWREHEQVARVPGLDGRQPGPGSHLEVVFALRPEAGTTSFELADVALEPVR